MSKYRNGHSSTETDATVGFSGKAGFSKGNWFMQGTPLYWENRFARENRLQTVFSAGAGLNGETGLSEKTGPNEIVGEIGA